MSDLLRDLGRELTERRFELLRRDAYFRDGYVDALEVPARARPELVKIIQSGVTNWLRLTVETTAERLIVDGFRRSEDPDADREIWGWWQSNRLDGRQMPHYVEVLKSGYGFVSVWPGDEPTDPPVIRCESPFSTFVRYEADDPDEPTSALKMGRNGRAWLYLPDSVSYYEWDRSGSAWRMYDELENPLGAVPFVRFRANPTVDGGYASDLDVAIPIQDRITRTTIERLIAAYFSAFRQRYATGLVLDVDDDGNPIAPFNAAADRIWISDDPQVRFGEFGEATLTNYVRAVEADVQHLAAVTRTPPHYLLGGMANLSAEALVAAETGLSRKVAERQQTFGEAWEDVIRLAAIAADRPEIATDPEIETIWRRTETVSEAQVVDAATKLASIDVPIEALWERIGASPQQIARWRRMATGDALRSALRTPLRNGGAADPTVDVVDDTATQTAEIGS
jgi:hypothetical protein